MDALQQLAKALAEPYQFEFFRLGSLAALLSGALCGLLGVYIVLRGMSYIGHGLSHAIFGGAVATYVLGWNFYLGAGAWGFVAALLIQQTVRRTRINADAAIGVVTTASFAIGVALISRNRRFTQSFDAALFGSILGVRPEDVVLMALVLAVTIVVVVLAYRPLLFTTFDPGVADVYGVRTERIETLFALLLAAALIVTMRVLGVTLIAAALVIPAITARLLTDSFHRMLLLSVLMGGLTGLGGMYLSYFADVASGATIVLLQSAVFVVALVIAWLQHRAQGRLVPTHV
jgi:manganese/iron transport system permease protein/iron/zinc/copper transport system permease protein